MDKRVHILKGSRSITTSGEGFGLGDMLPTRSKDQHLLGAFNQKIPCQDLCILEISRSKCLGHRMPIIQLKKEKEKEKDQDPCIGGIRCQASCKSCFYQIYSWLIIH